MPDKKPNNSKGGKKEEKSILKLRPWEKDDYVPNPTASIYPYNYTPKINKYGFLTKVPVSFMPSLLVGGIGAEFPRKGINANIVGTKFLSDNPNFKVGVGGGISKKFGKLNAGLEIGSQPKINLKYNFKQGGDLVSKLGYKDYSPFRNESSLKIHTPNKYIDMDDVSVGIYANGKYLPPNSGSHYMGTTEVLETRAEEPNVFLAGGKVPNIPTWNYPSKGTPIYKDTSETPPNVYEYGGGPDDPPPVSEQALQNWHKQNLQTWNSQSSPISETSELGKTTLGDWWGKIGREDYSELAKKGQTPHWSALTMSLAEMSMLGANTAEEARTMGFQPSSAHSTYIRNAFKTSANPSYKYNALTAAPLDNNVNVGDIYFYGRKGKSQDASNWEFKDFQNATEHFPSHADRVISKGEDKGGEFVILAGGNNRYDSYGEKKVYLKSLGNKYKGKLVRNLNSTLLPKERFEIIAKEPDKVDPAYSYMSKVPEHKKILQNLNHSTNLKLEELPNLIRFSILEGLRTNRYTQQQAKEEINIALKNKNEYLTKLLKPAMFRQGRVDFSKGSALGKSKM